LPIFAFPINFFSVGLCPERRRVAATTARARPRRQGVVVGDQWLRTVGKLLFFLFVFERMVAFPSAGRRHRRWGMAPWSAERKASTQPSRKLLRKNLLI
jgi:hypothetical protein